MTNYGYIRVSPADNDDSLHLQALQGYAIDEWIKEHATVKAKDRLLLTALIEKVREGDKVHVSGFTQLAGNTAELLKIVDALEQRNAHIVSVHEDLDTSTEEGRIKAQMLRDIVSFQKDVGRETQQEGIARAQAEGKYKGRVRIEVPNFKKYYKKYIEKKATKSALAKEIGISRPTLDRLIREHEASLQKE